MPLFPSDFKKFKHVKSDDKTTTLQHPKGHQITIMHSALKGDMRKQLEALSKIPQEAQDTQDKDEMQHKMSKGGEVCYACGGEVHMQDGGIIDTYRKKAQEGDFGIHAQVEQEPKPSDKYKGMGNYTGDPSVDVRTPEQKARAAQVAKENGYAKGGQVQHYAEGTPNETVQAPQPNQTQDQVPQDVINGPGAARTGRIPEGTEAATKANTVAIDPDVARKQDLYNKEVAFAYGMGGSYPQETELFSKDNASPQHFSPELGAKAEQQFQQEKAQNAANAAQAQQQAIQANTVRTQFGMQPVEVPNVPTGPQVPGSEIAQTSAGQGMAAPQAQPDSLSQGMNDMQGMLKSGYNKEMQGIQQEATARGNLGNEQAQILHQQQQDRQTAQIAYQKKYDDLNQERQMLMHDVQNGFINPEQYWTGDKNGNGGHSKIMASIGMIIAGFNPTNRPNAAIEYLNKQMDNNINAQKTNLDQKQNLLSANLRQFGNLKDATEMTRLQQADMMTAQLQEAAAKATSPMAKAAGLEAAGKLQAQYAPLFQQFAMKQSLMGLANGGGSPGSIDHMLQYMRITNPEMAKEMESRYVPGVGLGSIPVPEKIREQITSQQQLSAAAKDLLTYSQKHTNLVPGTADYNIGVQKSMILQQKIREGMLGTVFRESEKPLLQSFIDDNPAGAMKQLSSQPKLRTIIDSNEMQLNMLKRNYGFPEQKQAQQDQFKTVNGVKYKRGPNGEAIPVK